MAFSTEKASIPLRRCGCGEAAPCVRAWRSRNITVQGVRYEHACASCKKTFSVDDAKRIFSALVAAVALSCVGILIVAHPPGAAIGADGENRWFGLGLVAFAAGAWLRLALMSRTRSLHPASLVR